MDGNPREARLRDPLEAERRNADRGGCGWEREICEEGRAAEEAEDEKIDSIIRKLGRWKGGKRPTVWGGRQ